MAELKWWGGGKRMYENMSRSWVKHADFVLLDILGLELSFFLSYILRHGLTYNSTTGGPYQDLSLILVAFSICATFFLSSYKGIIRRGYLRELKQTMFHCMFITVGMIVWMFMIKESSSYSRIIIFIMYPISVCVLYVMRLFWKRNIRRRMKEKKVFRKMLILSTTDRIEEAIEGLSQPYSTYQLSGCVLYDTSEKVGTGIRNIPLVTDREGMLGYIQKNIIDEVFIDLPGMEAEAERLMNIFVNMGLVVHINLARFGSSMKHKQVHEMAEFTVLSSGMKFATASQTFLKRTMDICGALVGLLITGGILCIFGPIIKKQSPGAILFSQQRVGRNGRRFKIYKLRTMYPDAEERKKELMAQNKMKGLMFKMDDDPRIIPIGHFLRKTSLDEFPQFWNVLKGDMSLVGTRPPTVDEYEQYELAHRKRLAMKPGLTGMWQVSGRSDIVDFEEVVTLDAKYITEWTLGMDIKILWKTVKIMLTREGAV